MASPAGSASLGHQQAQQDSCTGVAAAFTIVSIILVGLRTYTRRVIVRNLGKDDWMMLCALVLTIAYLAAIFILRENGMGFSGARLSLDQMENLIQVTLAIECIYYLVIFSIKISILFFYLRIASVKNFQLGCNITIGVLTGFVVICLIVCLVQCLPLHKMWDIMGTVQGHCINSTAFFYSTSAFNIITDVWILALPIKTLIGIQRPNREKFALIVVFSLGIFSCIASIVRLHSIRIYTESKDPFYDSVPVNLWSMVEINIGIWCASIPSLKALISRSQRERTRTTGYNYHSRDKSGHQISSNKVGSSSGGSQGEGEAYDMHTMPNPVQQPRQAARKPSNVDSERSSQELFQFSPVADSKV